MSSATSPPAVLLDPAAGLADDAAILIVDADPASRAALRALVAPLAHHAEAATADEALRVASERSFAAILIDAALPGTDALELIAQLRDSVSAHGVPVLLVGAAPAEVAVDRQAQALGVLGYLTTPIEPQALRARLDLALTVHRQRARLQAHDRLLEQQQAALAETRAALAEAAAANRTKDLYMGVLGHDLRNPLGAILMSARTMLMRGSLSVGDQQGLSRIARNGERMAALIRDILDYTRGQAAGGIPIVPRPADMGEICASMIDEMTLLHGDRAIRLDSRGDLRGTWDRERVEQVLSNLLSNALAHGTGDLVVTAEGRPEAVLVSVQNGGAAIPPAQLTTLFEPFRRGTSSRGGLGLGLFIVKEIMRSHGGTVAVASTPEAGTCFTTQWPRMTAPIQEGTST